MDNYKNYRELGEYDGDKAWTPSDPVEYDDVALKQKSCSHIDWKEYRDGRIICDSCRLEI